MSGYKPHPAPAPLLIGFDPVIDLPSDHLAYLVDAIVDEAIVPEPKAFAPGQPQYDPRMLYKVLLYSMLTGVHSSRRMEANCRENLPFLLLVRDDRPSYHALSTARLEGKATLKELFVRLDRFALKAGMPRVGRISIDSSKFAASASKDSVVERKDYDAVLAEFDAILAKVAEVDAREDAENLPSHSRTGISQAQMRDILRSVGKDRANEVQLSKQMVKRVEDGVKTIQKAKAEKLSHVSLTDPDARMMPIGVAKKTRMGHMFEAVTDSGLLLVAETGNHQSDNDRLIPLVEMALDVSSSVPVTQVSADSGYYQGGSVKRLLDTGLDVVVPDSVTAGELRRPAVSPTTPAPEFTPVEGQDAYICPKGNILKFKGQTENGGQRFTKYLATDECLSCSLASACLQKPNAKRRNLTIGEFKDELATYLKRFKDPEVLKAYNARGPAVETVFAVIHSVLGFHQWHLRGEKGVAAEGALLSCAYQLKKIQVYLRKTGKTFAQVMG